MKLGVLKGYMRVGRERERERERDDIFIHRYTDTHIYIYMWGLEIRFVKIIVPLRVAMMIWCLLFRVDHSCDTPR